MKRKKDPRDVVYNYDGVNYVGSYDSKGNFHPPCRPPERPKKSGCSCERKDETSAEIDKLNYDPLKGARAAYGSQIIYEKINEIIDAINKLEREEKEEGVLAEPLIKDEKVRKAVRIWADSLRDVMCDGAITFYVDTAYCTFNTDVWKSNDKRDSDIAELDLVFDYGGLEDSLTYTIAELCGEEEE